MERMPDVHPKVPLVPARLEWKSGETMTMRDDDGLPKMVPQFDPVLEDFVERHGHGRDDREAIAGAIQIYATDQKTWDSIDVVQKVKGELQAQTGQWYEERDLYREDAISCYNSHGNPTADEGCPDYMSDAKMIGRGRFKDDDGKRHEIPPQFRQYLCYMCPFQHAYVQVELRRKRGLYDERFRLKGVKGRR